MKSSTLRTAIPWLASGLTAVCFVFNVQATTLEEARQRIGEGQYEQAFAIYDSLAKAGDAKAQFNLGLMYQSGDGVNANLEQAVYWFGEAAKQGYTEAQYTLAAMVFHRDIQTLSYPQALELYRKAAINGHTKSQLNLGMLYYRGEVIERDLNEAVLWILRAAEQNNSEAQSILGQMYLHGEGVTTDKLKGVMWLYLSVNNKEERNKARHTKIFNFHASQLSKEEQEQVKQMAEACESKQLKSC